MHGHSWLKENPHACAVLGWQGATSASLLADASAASLLCATHHAVTDGLQQKPLQSHPALHHGAGGGSIHPIPLSLCISPTSEGRKKGRMALGRSRPSWNTLEVTADPKPSQLQEFTPDQPFPPLNLKKRGVQQRQLNNSLLNVCAMKGAGKNVPDHMTGEDIGLCRE